MFNNPNSLSSLCAQRRAPAREMAGPPIGLPVGLPVGLSVDLPQPTCRSRPNRHTAHTNTRRPGNESERGALFVLLS